MKIKIYGLLILLSNFAFAGPVPGSFRGIEPGVVGRYMQQQNNPDQQQNDLDLTVVKPTEVKPTEDKATAKDAAARSKGRRSR